VTSFLSFHTKLSPNVSFHRFNAVTVAAEVLSFIGIDASLSLSKHLKYLKATSKREKRACFSATFAQMG